MLMQRVDIGASPSGPDYLPPQQLLEDILRRTNELVKQQYKLLNEEIFPELSQKGINFIARATWTKEQKVWLEGFFQSQIVPVLTPITLDPSRPFPRLLNKSLNFIVRLDGKDAFGRRRHRAIVQAPRSLPRIIRLPDPCRARSVRANRLERMRQAHCPSAGIMYRQAGHSQGPVARQAG